jgi:hypothetical protein
MGSPIDRSNSFNPIEHSHNYSNQPAEKAAGNVQKTQPTQQVQPAQVEKEGHGHGGGGHAKVGGVQGSERSFGSHFKHMSTPQEVMSRNKILKELQLKEKIAKAVELKKQMEKLKRDEKDKKPQPDKEQEDEEKSDQSQG